MVKDNSDDRIKEKKKSRKVGKQSEKPSGDKQITIEVVEDKEDNDVSEEIETSESLVSIERDQGIETRRKKREERNERVES